MSESESVVTSLRNNRVLTWSLAALLCFCMTVLHWPGELTPDAARQLSQAKTGNFTDWHPPITAMIWSLWPAPAFMLLLQLLLHWTGIALLANKVGGRWRFGILLVGLTPIAFKYLGVLQKDTLLASTFLFAFGLYGTKWSYAAGFAGALVRANGPFALAGLMRLRWPLVIVVVLSMIPVSMVLNRAVAERTFVERSLPFYDLAGIAHFTGDTSRFPHGCYTPLFWDTLGEQRCNYAYETAPKSLTAEWIRSIAVHPVAYSQHRLAHFNMATFFLVPVVQQCREAPEMHDCDDPLAKDLITKNALLWPITWLAAGLVLLWSRSGGLARALTLSGLAYGFLYAAVGVASDFRYFYWTELAVQLALVIHVAQGGHLKWKTGAVVIATIWVAGYTARALL